MFLSPCGGSNVLDTRKKPASRLHRRSQRRYPDKRTSKTKVDIRDDIYHAWSYRWRMLSLFDLGAGAQGAQRRAS
jgi:hypothetical protein